ncbi:unnamed protein product [Thlaspi arvense]|uniref:F-box domain-containing protein n=1 Tax=Thlaspi arvense TaxID=13288 RepID=A0AAU9SFH0_THLAR|nr:unnamed protein product [Thlaspi arvense]
MMAAVYIPLDLQIEILLRLPEKSLYRFRSVSKVWYSIITSDFMNIVASLAAPPRLLIAFAEFYGEESLVASLLSSSSSSYRDFGQVNIKGKVVYNAVRGLICVGAGFANVGICNPSTRQVHNLPQLRFKSTPQIFPRPEYIFGYDPVEDQYKVLAVDQWPQRGEHKVLVLGGEEAWREASCVICPHFVYTRGLYMNGAMYYGASKEDINPNNGIFQNTFSRRNNNSIIVSFDVRLETFNIIKVPSKVLPIGYKNLWGHITDKTMHKTLINYRGKIGVVEKPGEDSFKMWVVEVAEKEEWSFNTFHLPESAAGLDFKVVDTFHNGEICLVPRQLSDPFRLFYYNLEKKSMRSVIIEGLPVSKFKQVHQLSVTVSEHHESFMLLET